MKKIVFLLLINFTILSFAQEKEILKVMTDQQSAWNDGNIEGFMQGYWNSEEMMFIGKNGPTYGWQKTLNNYKSLTQPRKKWVH